MDTTWFLDAISLIHFTGALKRAKGRVEDSVPHYTVLEHSQENWTFLKLVQTQWQRPLVSPIPLIFQTYAMGNNGREYVHITFMTRGKVFLYQNLYTCWSSWNYFQETSNALSMFFQSANCVFAYTCSLEQPGSKWCDTVFLKNGNWSNARPPVNMATRVPSILHWRRLWS